MSCCGQARSTGKVEYHYTAPGGQKTVYAKEIEARAAVIKNGGSYTTRRS